ncbi:MAG: hypothetical protein M1838_003990 [Thelocarpon superellum]|nr:MAG: hypothetical protein M1838_003990 [Thelocarpon superellum]
MTTEDGDLQADAWAEELRDRTAEILDRKRSSVAGRETTLSAYCRLLTRRYMRDELQGRTQELVVAMIRSVKAEDSEREAAYALKALGLTIVTDPSDTIYELVYQAFQRAIMDSHSALIKSSAIHALGTATFYGGAASSEVLNVMDFLREIIESDGLSVEAPDAANVVIAALEQWAFLATQLDDVEEISQDAMEAFVDQLDSSDAGVQIAAGENIALIFEKSYTEQEDDEVLDSSDDEDFQADAPPGGPKMVKRYDAYRRVDHLKHQLASLASISSRRLSKRDKKSLHTSFADILNSVEHPTRGPRYSNALDQTTGRRYGSRMTVRVHRTGVMKIDKWWKLHRLQALRRILGAGFVIHYERNEVIFDSLPIMISKDA